MDTKTRPLYMLSTRDPPQNRGHIQTESEGLEKDIPFTFKVSIDKYDPIAIYVIVLGSSLYALFVFLV